MNGPIAVCCWLLQSKHHSSNDKERIKFMCERVARCGRESQKQDDARTGIRGDSEVEEERASRKDRNERREEGEARK